MILVTLGTFEIEFKRPLIQIDELLKNGIINEEVIVQCGHTKYESSHFRMVPFFEPETLNGLYQAARIVITHAGTGSILKGVKLGKKVIAIARMQKYNECVDDHQMEILNEFSKLGYLLAWHEEDSLKEIISRIDDFKPNLYLSGKQYLMDYLKRYIDQL